MNLLNLEAKYIMNLFLIQLYSKVLQTSEMFNPRRIYVPCWVER